MSKDIKNLKVIGMDIDSFKKIDYANTDFWEYNIISWPNWYWKSSLIDWIVAAILSNKYFWVWASSLVKHWKNKATITLLIRWENKEITIKRTFKRGSGKKPLWTTKLEAEMDWEKMSQEDLNNLFWMLTLDPIKLWTLAISKQIKLIKDTVKLDTSEIDLKIENAVESRKESKRGKSDAISVYEEFTINLPKKTQKVSMSELLEAKDEFSYLDRMIEDKKDLLDERKSIKNKIEELQEVLNKINSDWKALNEKISIKEEKLEKKYWSRDDLEEKISNADEINKEAIRYEEFIKAKKHKEDCEEDVEKCEKEVEEARAERFEMLKDCWLPGYMEINDDYWILVDWTEYSQLNTARKIEVWIDLVLLSETPLKMIRIENGWELDIKTLKTVKEKVIEAWFQIFIEKPITHSFDTIVLNEEWEVEEWEWGEIE